MAKEKVWDRLPPRTREEQDEFYQCPACGQVYWKGSHYRRMARFVEHLLG
ncbi:MAG: Mut7-C RNAse domain-containing protein [Anaerolineae bacterium]